MAGVQTCALPIFQVGYKSSRIGLSAACISCARLLAAQTYTTVRRKQLLKLLRKIAAGTLRFSRYLRCGVLVARARRLTKHLHRLAIFLFVKLHGYIECIQKFFSGSRFVKQRIISNQAVSFQRIGVKGFNSILRQQSIIVAKIL